MYSGLAEQVLALKAAQLLRFPVHRGYLHVEVPEDDGVARLVEKGGISFLKLLERGVGVVALHHSIGAFQDWSGYRRIIGTKFYLKETEENGVKYQVGSYKHDVDFKVYVKDSEHPVTHGINDFSIHDETYKGCVFEQDNRVLLTTDHPASDEPLCWVRNYAKARVCYIQIGHGPGVYDDTNYRRLVLQAIKWCAVKED